jgi:hypothetical protein
VAAILERLPAWATTGVGSLPFADPAAAIEHVRGGYEIPFCPQLPRLDGDMVTEWLGADPRRCGWSPDRDRERPHAWDRFLASVRSDPPAHGVVKIQVTGPVTLAVALERQHGGAHSRRAAAELANEISSWLAASAAEQVRVLGECGLDVLLMVDEPAVDQLGVPGLDRVWDPLRAVAAVWGLHLCCRVPWELVERVEPQVLSFDLTLESPLPGRAKQLLSRLAERGGRVGWGAVAPHRCEGAQTAVTLIETAIEGSGVGGASSLITPACGSGRVSMARERRLACAVDQLARGLRSSRADRATEVHSA